MKLELFLLFLLLIIFPFGQLTKLPFNISEVNVYFHDLIILFLFFIWVIKKVLKKERFIRPVLIKPIFAFVSCAGFSLILASPNFKNQEIAVAFSYLIRWSVYAGIYFVLSDFFNKNNMDIKLKIYDLLIIAATTAAILGLIQYIFIPDIRPLTAFAWDPHYYRVVGSYLDPGYTGMIYVLGLILLVNKLWQTKTNNKKREMRGEQIIINWFFILSFFTIYSALALTYARSAYLAYLSAMTFIAWHKRSIKFFLIVLLMAVFTFVLLPRPGGEGVKLERQSTVWSRVNNWKQSLNIALDHPLFGVGFNTYRYVQKKYGFLSQDNWRESHAGAGADSSLMFVFATTGIIGLITYILLIIKILVINYRKNQIVIVSSLTSLLIHSFFNNSLFYPWIMVWMWFLLAIEGL